MVNSNEKKSLMEKFNLAIYQLDYKYIDTCTNVKQLERILKVLRSGEEGVYPHLVKFCESRLQGLDPRNVLLVPITKILHYRDLTAEERKEISTDLENWSRDCSEPTIEKDDAPEQSCSLPPVRTQKPLQRVNDSKSADVRNENQTDVKKYRTPRSYKDWDKFNVDEELAKVDGNECGDSKSEKAQVNTPEISTPEISKTIPVKGLSQKEREHIANLEKLKGNEAFKAQDFKESVTYYTRSLSACKTASTYNNRAQAHIKLKNYVQAVLDCNEAISMEPNNLKALYRRGIAYKEAKMYDLARIDFSIFLELDPDNNLAKKKLEEVERLMEQEPKAKNQVVIEELESKTYNNNLEVETSGYPQDEVTLSPVKNTRTRITIEEVQEEEERRPLLDEICNCAEDLPQVSQKTRELLSIKTSNKSNKTTKSQAKPIVVSEKYIKKAPVNVLKTSEVRKLEVSEDSKAGRDVKENFGKKIESVGVNVESGVKENFGKKIESVGVNVESGVEGKVGQKIESVGGYVESDVEGSEITEKKLGGDMDVISDDSCLKDGAIQDVAKEFEAESVNKRDLKEVQPTKTLAGNIDIGIHESKLTPFEFTHKWQSNNANSNHSIGESYLLSIHPKKLPSMLTNKIEAPFLYGILMAIGNMVHSGKVNLGYEYLNNLTNISRIELAALFLSKEEKRDIDVLLNKFEELLDKDLNHHRKILKV